MARKRRLSWINPEKINLSFHQRTSAGNSRPTGSRSRHGRLAPALLRHYRNTQAANPSPVLVHNFLQNGRSHLLSVNLSCMLFKILLAFDFPSYDFSLCRHRAMLDTDQQADLAIVFLINTRLLSGLYQLSNAFELGVYLTRSVYELRTLQVGEFLIK
jgi:hypothetical protein